MADRIIASGDANPIPSNEGTSTAGITNAADAERIEHLFQEIAELAERCERIFYFTGGVSGDERYELEMESVREVTNRIGWLADIGCELTGATPQREADPERWMRPAAYQGAKTGGEQ